MRGITNAVGSAGEKNFLMKYNGVDQLILDLKGSPINVNIGDYVYNEFNYTKLLGAPNIVNYDRTTPVQVVNAAYDTSGNGGRKLVRLDNGWLVSVVRDTTNGRVRFHKSQDNGATWTQIGYIATSVNSVAITNIGNIIKLVLDQGTYFDMVSFDATQNSGDIPINLTNFPSYFDRHIDSGQTSGSIQSSSLAIDQNGHLHATWSSKNATYPNSFNIRYSKSTNGGVTWASPEQRTTSNTTGADYTNPTIVIKNDNNPIIICSYSSSTQKRILSLSFAGTWANVFVYIGDNYAQSNPSATVDSDGVIHVVWHGFDSTDTSRDNIRYSKSTDNGATWSAMLKLTTGNANYQLAPSITTDSNNNVHIVWDGSTASSAGFQNIRYIKNTGTWGAIEEITTFNTTANQRHPSVCDNYKNFENPILIWQDSRLSRIVFYGKWTEYSTPVQVIPPMSLATNKEQLQALYADTLKMYNPNTDARYQGFVSKKDLWTIALQELQWATGSVKINTNLFGLIGTAYDGKKSAAGSVASTGGTLNFLNNTGSSSASYYVTVSSLTFTPSLIEVYQTGAPYEHIIYTANKLGSNANSKTVFCLAEGYTPQVRQVTGEAYVNSTGFRLPCNSGSTTYSWRAIE